METNKKEVVGVIDDLKTCQRCGRLFIEKEHKVCNRCVEELDHNMEGEGDE